MPREVLVLLWIAVIGVVAWLLVAFVPLPYPFPVLIVGAALILAILMAVRAFGWSPGPPP